MDQQARRFRQAGLTYVIGGVAVVVFTLAAGLVPPSRLPGLAQLVPGLGFVIVFGTIIALAPTLWRWRWTLAPTVWLVRVLAVTNAGRTLFFLLSAGGLGIQVLPPSRQTLSVTSHDAEPLFLVNASLNGLITLMLARAGWARD